MSRVHDFNYENFRMQSLEILQIFESYLVNAKVFENFGNAVWQIVDFFGEFQT